MKHLSYEYFRKRNNLWRSSLLYLFESFSMPDHPQFRHCHTGKRLSSTSINHSYCSGIICNGTTTDGQEYLANILQQQIIRNPRRQGTAESIYLYSGLSFRKLQAYFYLPVVLPSELRHHRVELCPPSFYRLVTSSQTIGL